MLLHTNYKPICKDNKQTYELLPIIKHNFKSKYNKVLYIPDNEKSIYF